MWLEQFVFSCHLPVTLNGSAPTVALAEDTSIPFAFLLSGARAPVIHTLAKGEDVGYCAFKNNILWEQTFLFIYCMKFSCSHICFLSVFLSYAEGGHLPSLYYAVMQMVKLRPRGLVTSLQCYGWGSQSTQYFPFTCISNLIILRWSSAEYLLHPLDVKFLKAHELLCFIAPYLELSPVPDRKSSLSTHWMNTNEEWLSAHSSLGFLTQKGGLFHHSHEWGEGMSHLGISATRHSHQPHFPFPPLPFPTGHICGQDTRVLKIFLVILVYPPLKTKTHNYWSLNGMLLHVRKFS